MILISKYLVPKGYIGITIFPFVFLKKDHYKGNSVLIAHEKIHLRQQVELLVIPFFVLYGIEFLFRYYHHKNWHDAYKNISFEREAYLNESNANYLNVRPFYNFVKYI